MELLPLPFQTERALRDRSVGPQVRLAVRLVVTCLEKACADVAEDCDRKLRHDDSTSEGQLRWRRCRNHVKLLLDEESVPGLEAAVADVTDNALVVRAERCALSFYSARNGTDHPDLAGQSKTKRAVVDEMQLQIEGLEAPDAPKRLVVVYEADEDGMLASVVGVLSDARRWAWCLSTYEREGFGRGTPTAPVAPPPTYDSEPEPMLPDIQFAAEGKEAKSRRDG
jgi:hypothetical protein